jgi:VCBS repeat-containing protein
LNFAGPFDSDLTHNSPVSLGGERFSFDSKPGFVQHHASDSHVVIPDAHLLFSGEYTRIGSDLIISGNGQKFVVGNYFKGETRPALTSKDGATLAGHIVDALTGHVHYAQATAAPAAGVVIGHIQKLSGSATVIRNGVSVELNIGDAVQKGDVVQTGSNSTLGMTFIDGSAFGMTSNARMVLNEMIFDPNGSSNSSLISLVQGTITFVAGQTAKNGNMRVETPVATMGIRGTAVLVEIGANDGPTKFSVLVEPDGHTGSYNLYDKVTGQLIGTVSQAGQVTFVSSLGIGQPPSAVEQLKTLADQQAEKALIQQVFQLYFPNYNPDDSNPKLPKFGFSSSGNNLAEILFTTNSNNTHTLLTQIELRFAVTDPVTGVTTYQSKIYYNTKAQFSASSILSAQTFVSTVESFKISDLVHIDDPDVGNAPFYDIATPFVAGSAIIKSAVSTNPNLSADFLSQFLHIDQTTGVITFDRLGFNFLGNGESVTFMIQVTSQSGPDVAHVIIPVTITGDNDVPNDNGVPNGAPTIVLSLSDIIGAIKEDTLVTPDHTIVTNGTITFRDVDLTDTHTIAKDFTSASSTLPGFAGAPLGTFTIDLDPENTTDIVNTGTVQWHFSLPENDPTLQSLAEGQTITQIYTITITDEYGAFVTQDVTITITGTNDAPVLTADTAPVHQATEIFNSTNSVVEDIVSGTLTFADLDLTDTHQAVATLNSGLTAVVWSGGTYSGIPAATVAALYSAMSAVVSENNADTNNQGSVTWQFKLPDYLFDFLGHSETLTVTYDITVADYNNGVATGTYSTQQVTVQITANNDRPVVTAITPNGAVQEDTLVETGDLLQTSGSVTFADADLTDTHTVQATYVDAVASAGASVSSGLAAALAATALSVPSTALDAATHTFNWSFALDNSLVQYLAAGETVTATYTINVTDNSGVLANNTSAPQTVTVTITGTNDVPVIAADTSGTSGTNVHDLPETDAGLITSGTLAVTDADVTNTVTASVYDLDVAGTGTGGLPLALDNDTLKAMLSVDAGNVIDNASTAGTINWEFNSGSEAFDFLADGETLILTYTIRATDSDASHATGDQTIVVTITGSNDTPTVAAALTLNTSEGNAPVVKDLLEGAADADNGETATLTVTNVRYSIDGEPETTTTPGGVTIFPDAGTIKINVDGANPAFDHIAAGATQEIVVSYDVTDAQNATIAQTETITITGLNDRPVLAAGIDLTGITEDQTANVGQSVGSFATGVSDADDGALKGVAITGYTSQNGHWEYSIDDGATWSNFAASYSPAGGLLLASDDKVRFIPNGVNGGTDTLTYVAWDQTSGTHGQISSTPSGLNSDAFSQSSQTATLTVSEVNDAPVLNGDNVSTLEIGDGGVTHPDGTTMVFDVTLSDPDETGSLTVNATAGDGTVSGLNDGTVGDINDNFIGGITYTPNNTVQNANDMVTLTVTDSGGLSDTLHFVFQQNGNGGATLTGTTGKDLIFSTEGNDTLTGLAGQDNFVFEAISGNDTITDFQFGTDHIVLNGYGDPFAGNFSNWLDHEVTDTVNGAVIHLDVTNSITLTGVTKATLTANDFIIHPGVGI